MPPFPAGGDSPPLRFPAGGDSPPPPPPLRISGTWSKEESLLHINSLELRAVFLALMSLEIHVRGQSLLVRSDNTTVVSYIYQLPGRNSLPFSLFPDNRSMGVVSPEGYSSLGRLHSRKRQPGCRFSFQKEVPPFRMVSESISVPENLSDPYTMSGDRPLCVQPQLSAPQVLCSVQRPSCLESGLSLLPVDRPLSVCLPSLLHSSYSSGEDCSGRSRCGSSGSQVASETLVPEVVLSSGGTPQKDLIYQPLSHYPHPRLERLHLCPWLLSGKNVSRLAFPFCKSCSLISRSNQRLYSISLWFQAGVSL